jgi:hypothetical protein
LIVAVEFVRLTAPVSLPVQACHMTRMRAPPDVESAEPPVGTVHPDGIVGVTVFCMIQTMTPTSPAWIVGHVRSVMVAMFPPPVSAPTKVTTAAGYGVRSIWKTPEALHTIWKVPFTVL